MKIEIISKNFERNQLEELIQRAAWRLVRSADDRFGENKGQKKLDWSVSQLKIEFFTEGIFLNQNGTEKAEDYIRAAYINYRTEKGIGT